MSKRFAFLSRALLAGLGLAMLPVLAHAAPVSIVAAENFYGDLAQQIGGAQVRVTSIMSNPDQDPHLFEASPATARALHDARIVIYNGADYDPWMGKLLSASNGNGRTLIVAAELTGHKAGDNPHLWYDPATLPAVARELTTELSAADPAHKALFEANLGRFVASMQPINAKVAELRARYKGAPVTATEPVFGYMSDAIGLDMRNLRFQLAAMNDTEASPADVAAFEDDLRQHRVHVLIYNRQADDPTTRRMLGIARDAHVPNISVSETEPPKQTYQQWMLSQLEALGKALGAR
jgi:zinc/manganese transport system substrate-binding protein